MKRVKKMTNFEKYKNKITDIVEQGDAFALVNEKIVPCSGTPCEKCKFFIACKDRKLDWLSSEYKEPQIDWSKVPVDTKILVRDSDEDVWLKRHFAKYEDDMVYAWADGQTSYTAGASILWEYAKLYDGE